jgi:lysophospholipase L1-like esterase
MPEQKRLPFARYVAIGDSSTEGLDDPDGRGGYRGWADRLAGRVAAAQGPDRPLLYANFGIRGKKTHEILEQQLSEALALRPDLATLFTGTNDVVSRRFDAKAVGAGIETMLRALTGAGATVLTFTLPDLTPVLPLARPLGARVRALADETRRAASASGAILVDLAAHAVAVDPRLWSEDRIHANAEGHERISRALAHALNLPEYDASWAEPLPPRASNGSSDRSWLAAELRWWRRHLLPWIGLKLAGRSLGDGISPKRPALAPVELGDPDENQDRDEKAP